MVRPEQLALALVRRRERASDGDVLDAATVRARLDAVLLASPSRPLRAWLIGSLAWGGFGAGSDVDVVVEGLDVEATSRLAVHLVRQLPVMPQVLRLEELPPSFATRVLDEGIPLDVAG
jgi:predicted nucleotidyltransferase